MTRLLLTQDQVGKWAKNVLLFTAPALVIFFAQLSEGVELRPALLVAALALYGLIADYLRKLKK